MKRVRSLSRPVLALLALGSLGLACCSGLVTAFGGGMTDELRKKGVSAPARIVEIWDTGWTVNDNPVIGMKVHVQPDDRPPFEATIEKTTVSRIAVPQFQPGQTLLVRFDPDDPKQIAVDFEGPAPEAASSGNPFRDRFVRANSLGASLLPPPAEPAVYLGTADSAADVKALQENDYVLIGASGVRGAPDLSLALEQGKEVGASLVVVYGRFDPRPGVALDVLPFRPRPMAPDRGAGAGPPALVSNLGPGDQAAAYWGKTRPAVLGIVSRPLSVPEQERLGRTDGIVVDTVANGSPAAAAGLRPGDVIVAIDGEPLPDVRAVPARITSLAGRKVGVNLLRDGSPLSLTVQLNPASP